MPAVAKVFISYRRKPSAMLATLIAKELESHGIEVFVDTRKGDGAGPFPRHLLTAVENSDVFVCLLADTTFDSDWVRREIDHAFTMGKTMIPVFQESYRPFPETPETSIEMLLMSQGVHVLDEQNIYVDEAIQHLAVMIEQSVPGPADSPGETTVISPPTSPMRPQPSRTRWLWPLSALIILLIGFGVFLYLNGLPPDNRSEALTQTAIALAGNVTDTPTETPAPSETATSTLTDTPEPSATATPEPAVLVISALGANIRSEPSPADSAIGGIVVSRRLPITGITADGEFYRAAYNGQTVWIQNGPLVRVEGDLSTVPVVSILVISALGAYIRSEPSPEDSAVDGVVVSERLPITGVSVDGEFYRVDYNGQSVWIQNGPLVRVEGDLSTLPVVENSDS